MTTAFEAASKLATQLRRLAKSEAAVHRSVSKRYAAKRAALLDELTPEMRILVDAAQKAEEYAAKVHEARGNGDARPTTEILDEVAPSLTAEPATSEAVEIEESKAVRRRVPRV